MIDIAFYGVMAYFLLVYKKPGMAFPLTMTIYSGLVTLINLAVGGAPGGILALVLGIRTIIQMKKLKDAYNQFLITGQYPPEQI